MAGKCRTPKKEKRRGPKSKYNPDIHNKLVEGLAEVGFTDEQIAKKLNVSRSTLSLWKTKHSEFAKMLQKAKDEFDTRVVEQSLLKRAIGYSYVETTRELQAENDEGFGEDSESSIQTLVVTKKVTKQVAPDVTAQIFWLKNRQPERWRDRKDIAIGGTVKLILEDE